MSTKQPESKQGCRECGERTYHKFICSFFKARAKDGYGPIAVLDSERVAPVTKQVPAEPIRLADIVTAMEVFDSFSRIVLQRAKRADGTAGYLCSIPLELNDERRRGQRMETLDAEGETAAEAILKVANLARKGREHYE